MEHDVCPVWVGRLLANPLRKLFQNPRKILSPYVKEGMTVMDVGPAMGFFSIPMARMVGKSGKVICVDLQEKMLKELEKRAEKAGISEIIVTRVASQDSLNVQDYSGKIDFVLAFAMVHEVPDRMRLFKEISASLKPGGLFLVAEPTGHVSEKEYKETVSIAGQCCLSEIEAPKITLSRAMLFRKNAD